MLTYDVKLPAVVPELLIEKHADYLIAYGNNKDEYVSNTYI